MTSLTSCQTQFAPEYSQCCYDALRDSQDTPIANYIVESKPIFENEREAMVTLILELSKIKGYKPETAHLAISIADRYLNALVDLDECP